MNGKLYTMVAVAGLIAVLVAPITPTAAGADVITERRHIGPGVVEYEKHVVVPATQVIETRTVSLPATVERLPAATVTTTEKIFEQETWSGPAPVARRTTFKRHVARRPATKRVVKRVAMRRTTPRRSVAYRAPVRERIVEKAVVVEKPVVIEKAVVVEKPVIIEKPVYMDRVIEKPVFIDRVIERPVAAETQIDRVIEKPVYIDRVIEQPVVIQKRDRRHLLNLKLF